MNFIKELIGINVTTDMITVSARWMLIWPVLILNSFVYWRAIKSIKWSKK